jgi:hypothetical protein
MRGGIVSGDPVLALAPSAGIVIEDLNDTGIPSRASGTT